MFTHLRGNSHYSILEAIGTPGKIVDKASELGMDSIAITDSAGMYGAIEFYESAQKKGIKPIIGVELPISNNYEYKKNYIVLLAKNINGYQNLIELTSQGHLHGGKYGNCISFEQLEKHKEGIIGFMGGENSQIGNMILNKEDKNKIIEIIENYKNIFGQENFLLEIIAQDESKLENISKINQNILELSKSTNTKLVTNNNFSYVNDEEKEAYEVLLTIKNQGKISDNKLQGEYHIFSEHEIRNTLNKNGLNNNQIENIIENNNKVAESINVELPLGQILFPKYESTEEIKQLYNKHKDSLITNE